MTNPFFQRLDLWRSDDTYPNYRIPGMLVTDRGTLLVCCEARRSADDYGKMDILMQRSTDHGKTFGEFFKLAEGTDDQPTVNNPVMLQDKKGRIHFLYCESYTINGGRALRRYSDDDGITWSEPLDITEYTMPQYHNAWAFGPGHGIVTGDGTLLVPVWMVPKHYGAPIGTHDSSVTSTFYSKDNGETWHVGDIIEPTAEIIDPNETVAALTSDGKVYLNIRFKGTCRAKAYSEDGYSNWTQYAPDIQLPDPECFGSVAAYNDGKHPYTFIFSNCASEKERKCVTVRASLDNGRTWSVSKLLDAERGGYAEVAIDNNAGLIYVLYENDFGKTDHLAIFNYEWLMSDHESK